MNLPQDLEIFPNAAGYCARGRIDHAELASSADASEVIQAALNAVEGGGEVCLRRGSYRLSTPLRIPARAGLRGSAGARLVAGAECRGGAALELDSVHGVTLRDLTVVADPGAGTPIGVQVSGCGAARLDGLLVGGFSDCGIEVRNNTFLTHVRGCTLAANGGANLRFIEHYRGPHGDFIPNLVADCMIFGGGHGIECDRTIVLNLVGCVVYQATGYAFLLRRQSNSVLVSGCRSFQTTGVALRAEQSDELAVTGNIFCWQTGAGIEIENCCWGTITGNEVIDSGSYNSGGPDRGTKLEDLAPGLPLSAGIELRDTKGYSVIGNNIFNWEQARQLKHGVVESGASDTNVLVANHINYLADEALRTLGPATRVADNVSRADRAHRPLAPGREFVQSFEPERLRAFIQEQLGISLEPAS